jgi:kojibiose phosphorylase
VPHYLEPHNLVRIWTGDIEIHISADVAYAILQYTRATDEVSFLLECGLEILFDTARFWASRAEWNEARERYEFNDVIGPDEYHDHVDNNAYTNYMARWHLLNACKLLGWGRESYAAQIQELIDRLEITPEEPERWQEIAGRIYLPEVQETGLIAQFDGYFEREDVDLGDYAGRTRSMQAILGIDGANQTQILKQPDVLMLLYLLPELFDGEILSANFDYYSARTDHSHGSSTGPAIHSILANKVGLTDNAYELFKLSAFADLYDVRGNAGDGIHGASAGGLWQALVFGFAGLQFDDHGWKVNPRLPSHWKCLAFHFTYHGKRHQVVIDRQGEGYDIKF